MWDETKRAVVKVGADQAAIYQFFMRTHDWGVFKYEFCFILSQVAMKALGFEVKKADVKKVIKDYDREGTEKITFEDFNEVSKYH